MTVNLTTTQAALHLAGHERNDSLTQYIVRLRQAIISAKRRNDTQQLQELRVKFLELQALLGD